MVSATLARRTSRGRKPTTTSTEIGRAIRQRIDELGINQRTLARRLDIPESRLHNIMHGKVKDTQPLSEEKWCSALEYGSHGLSRREFLSRAKAAGIVATVALTGISLRENQSHAGPDLEMADSFATWLGKSLDAGADEAQGVMKEAEQWFGRLLHVRARRDQEFLGRVQVRWGSLLIRAQLASLPWWQRGYAILATSERVQRVIQGFPLSAFAHEYAWTLGLNIQMYREVNLPDQGIQSATWALDMLRDIADPGLEVLTRLNRAHIWATQGRIDHWKRGLDEGRAIAQRQAGEERKHFESLVEYFEAEGRKRIAENVLLELPGRNRRRYATDAFSQLQRSRESVGWFGEYAPHEGLGRALIHRVSEAQCLRWIDAREALERFHLLKAEAAATYPSLVEKIDTSVATLMRAVPGL